MYLQGTDFLARGMHWMFPQKQRRTRRKILLSNIAHFGDVVLSIDVIAQLAKEYPDSEIDFLGSEAARHILAGHPQIGRVHLFTHWRLLRTGGFFRRFYRFVGSFIRIVFLLRKGRYDCVIDMYPFYPNGALLYFLAGIPERIGYTSGGWGRLYTFAVDWEEKDIHVMEYHFELLQKIGVRQERRGVPVLPEIAFSIPGEYIVVHMGAGCPQKEWDVAHWKSVVSQMRKKIVVTGQGKREREMAEQLGLGEILVDRLSWGEFVSVIKGAKGVLCVDSVIGHVAAHFNVPTVVLFTGINNPVHWRPSHVQCRVMTKKVACAPCGNGQGCSSMQCIRGITPNEVVEAASSIF